MTPQLAHTETVTVAETVDDEEDAYGDDDFEVGAAGVRAGAMAGCAVPMGLGTSFPTTTFDLLEGSQSAL